jgi:hypothetical protein
LTTSTAVTNTTGYELLPDEAEAEPYYFNRGMLRELGSCGPYIRRHRELFSPAEFPDGPPINSVTCRTYADQFDWSWATSNMLDWQGRQEVDRIANSRASRYKSLGRGTHGNTLRFAAAFGYVFATRPDLRAGRMRELAELADERAEQRAREDLEEARLGISDAEARIKSLRENVERYQAELPALEAAVEHVKVRAAERAAERKERELAAAEARLTTLRAEVTRLRAEADRAAAVAQPTEESL